MGDGNLYEALQELRDYADDLIRARHGGVQSALQRYPARLTTDPVSGLVASVLPNVDFDGWLQARSSAWPQRCSTMRTGPIDPGGGRLTALGPRPKRGPGWPSGWPRSRSPPLRRPPPYLLGDPEEDSTDPTPSRPAPGSSKRLCRRSGTCRPGQSPARWASRRGIAPKCEAAGPCPINGVGPSLPWWPRWVRMAQRGSRVLPGISPGPDPSNVPRIVPSKVLGNSGFSS